MAQEKQLSLLNRLVHQIDAISHSTASNKLASLLEMQDYLMAFALTHALSSMECDELVRVLAYSVAPFLFEAGHYTTLGEKFKALTEVLKQQGERGKSGAATLAKRQADYADRERDFSPRDFLSSNELVGQIKTKDEFITVNEQLIQAFDLAYPHSEEVTYCSILCKRIHLQLAGYKNVTIAERIHQITEALQLSCEGLEWTKKETRQEITSRYFQQLMDVCFAYYVAAYSNEPIGLSLLDNNYKEPTNKTAMLKQLQASAHLLMRHAVLMANDKACRREGFILLAVARARQLYERILAKVKGDRRLPARAELTEEAISALLVLHLCEKTREAIQRLSMAEPSALIPWEPYRKTLHELRLETKQALEKEPTANALQRVTLFNQGLKHLIAQLFERCISVLGKIPLPYDYVLLGLGSLAREEACPFSDLECAFLIEGERFSQDNELHLKILLHLFKLCIIGLGETPFLQDSRIRSGFRLDHTYTPLNEQITLCGTPQAITAYIDEKNINDIEGLSAVQTACILSASVHGSDLYDAFQLALAKRLAQDDKPSKPLREKLADKLISVNAGNIALLPFAEDAQHIVSVKENLLRPLVFLMTSLNLSLQLDELSTLKRLEKLKARGQINPALAEMITLYFAFALRLRFLAHFHYGSEEGEALYFSHAVADLNNPFYLDETTYKMLRSFRESLMILLSECFQKPMLLATKLPKDYQTIVPALLLMAKEYEVQRQWESAFHYYHLVLKTCLASDAKHEKELMPLLQAELSQCVLLSDEVLFQDSLTAYLEAKEDHPIPWYPLHRHWCSLNGWQRFPDWPLSLSEGLNQGLRLLSLMSGHCSEHTALWRSLKRVYLSFLSTGIPHQFLAELCYWHPKEHDERRQQLTLLLRMYYEISLTQAPSLFAIFLHLTPQNSAPAALGELFQTAQGTLSTSILLEILYEAVNDGLGQLSNNPTLLTIDQLVNASFLNQLTGCVAQADYENWFSQVSVYLLGANAKLEAHRFYYRQLPDAYRNACLLEAKRFVKRHFHADYLNKDELFWRKLWDPPLSNGERSSHSVLKEEWLATLKKSFEANDEAAQDKKERIDIKGIKSGHFRLNAVIVRALIREKWITQWGRFALKKNHPVACRMPGNHLVIPWPLPSSETVNALLQQADKRAINAELLQAIQAKAQFYLKVYPEYPLVELFLNELTYRLGYYPPREVDLWRWDYAGYSYPLLVSAAVPGNSLQALLNNKAALSLHSQAFSQSLVLSALTRQEDNKPDNTIIYSDEEGGRACLIDADRVFVPSFKHNALHVKDILFCLPDMRSSIDAVFCEEFLSINPQSVLHVWVAQLKRWGEDCIVLFSDKIEPYFNDWLRVNERKTLLLPPLHSGIVCELYEHIQRLQGVLEKACQEGKSVTHWDLLSQIDTRLANHYRLAHEKTTHVLECFDYAAGHGYVRGKGNRQDYFTSKIDFKTQMQDMWAGLRDEEDIQQNWQRDLGRAQDQLAGLSGTEQAIRTAKEELMGGRITRFRQLKERGQETILRNLDWGGLIPETQRALLTLMKTRGVWLRLTINNSREITNEDLQILLQKSPALKQLVLKHCPKLSEESWSKLPEQDCALRTLYLEQLPQMKYLGYLGRFLYAEKCLSLPNLNELFIHHCQNLEEIHLKAENLEKLDIQLGPGMALRVVQTQSQYLQSIHLEDAFIEVASWPFILNSHYSYRLNSFTCKSSAMNLPHPALLQLIMHCPAYLSISWGNYPFKFLSEGIGALNQIWEEVGLNYLSITPKARHRLIEETKRLFAVFVKVEALLLTIGQALEALKQDQEFIEQKHQLKAQAPKEDKNRAMVGQDVDVCIKHLGEDNLEVKKEAAARLAYLTKPVPEALKALEKALNEKDPGLRVQAATTLIRLGEEQPKVITILIDDVKHALYKEVRMKAGAGLGYIKTSSSDIIDALIHALKDPDSYPVRIQAAESLEKIATTLKDQFDEAIRHFKENTLLPLREPKPTVCLNYPSVGFFNRQRKSSATEKLTLGEPIQNKSSGLL